MPTTGSDYDTVLAACTGADLSSLTEMACRDDISMGKPLSAISFPTLAGETYYFKVGGYLGAFGFWHFRSKQNGPRADEQTKTGRGKHERILIWYYNLKAEPNVEIRDNPEVLGGPTYSNVVCIREGYMSGRKN